MLLTITVPANYISSSIANISWRWDYNYGTITEWGVCWNMTGAPTHNDSKTPTYSINGTKSNYLIAGEYIDFGISAFKKKRPKYLELMEQARQRKISVVLVYKLDRWGR